MDWLSTKKLKDPLRCFRHSPVHHHNRRTHCLLIQSTLCEKGIYSIHRSVFKTQHLALSIETINNLRERSINALSLYKTNQKMFLGYIFCISVIHFIKKQFNTQEDVDVKCSFIYFTEKTILMLKIIFDFFFVLTFKIDTIIFRIVYMNQ